MKLQETEKKFHARIRGEYIRLDPHTEDDDRSITKFLKENNIEGFILPIGIVRPIKEVIRGLPSDIPVEEIKEELLKSDYPVFKVAQLIQFKTQKPMSLFQIQLTPSNMAKKIFELDALFYIKITVER